MTWDRGGLRPKNVQRGLRSCGVVRLHGKVHEMPSLPSPLCFDSAYRYCSWYSRQHNCSQVCSRNRGASGCGEMCGSSRSRRMPATAIYAAEPPRPTTDYYYLGPDHAERDL